MLNSGKKIRALNEKKTHCPPPCKLNGRSLKTFTQIPHSQWFIDIGYVYLATKNYGST